MKGQLLAECGFELASEYEPAFSELMNVEVVFLAQESPCSKLRKCGRLWHI